jgi:hemolysin activation/secretion protein
MADHRRKKKGESVRHDEPENRQAEENGKTETPTETETTGQSKPETLADLLKRKADVQDCLNAFQGDQVSSENFLAVMQRLLDAYINSIPLSLTQAIETCIQRMKDQGAKNGEQSPRARR